MASREQGKSSLEKGDPNHSIVTLTDRAIPVDLTGSILSRRQTEVSAHVPWLGEPLRIIDRGRICEGNDRADTRHGHQPTTGGVGPGCLKDHAMKSVVLAA
jgi:hypothetical protein